VRIALIVGLAFVLAAAAQASGSAGPNAYTFNIYEIGVDGSGRQALLQNPHIRNVQDISPDRTRILFFEPTGLYSAVIDGSDIQPAPAIPLPSRSLASAAWSSSGRRIAIQAWDDSPCGPVSSGCAIGEIWLASAQGSSIRRLVTHAIAPSWSPSSHEIAFVGRFNTYAGQGAISVVTANGPALQRQLGQKEFSESTGISWSPRGDQFAYTTWGRGRSRVAVVRANGRPRHSVRTPFAGSFEAWSDNGKWLVFREGSSHRLIVARPDGRQRHFLTVGGFGPTAWSPDGRWLAFTDEVGRYCYQIFVIRPNGRDRRQLTNEQCSSSFQIFWSRDSKHVIYPLGTYDSP
jgi:Tol biopolymer transport system component